MLQAFLLQDRHQAVLLLLHTQQGLGFMGNCLSSSGMLAETCTSTRTSLSMHTMAADDVLWSRYETITCHTHPNSRLSDLPCILQTVSSMCTACTSTPHQTHTPAERALQDHPQQPHAAAPAT